MQPPQNPHSIQICPLIAPYKYKKHKDACIRNMDPDADDVEEHKVGATIASATKQWRKRQPTVSLMCSSITPAHVRREEGNSWHVVALASADSSTIFVHDPNFNAAAFAGGGRHSFKDVPMNSTTIPMVRDHFTQATEVWLQSPPDDFDRNLGECMGRSAQWLEAKVVGRLPWPPNSTTAGGVWHRFNVD